MGFDFLSDLLVFVKKTILDWVESLSSFDKSRVKTLPKQSLFFIEKAIRPIPPHVSLIISRMLDVLVLEFPINQVAQRIRDSTSVVGTAT